MGYKEDFIGIYRDRIRREGADRLLTWLQTTDFFTAPASTRFHGACEGGLVMHSLNVYRVLHERYFGGEKQPRKVLAACGERWRPWRSVATWYLWRSLDPLPVEY